MVLPQLLMVLPSLPARGRFGGDAQRHCSQPFLINRDTAWSGYLFSVPRTRLKGCCWEIITKMMMLVIIIIRRRIITCVFKLRLGQRPCPCGQSIVAVCIYWWCCCCWCRHVQGQKAPLKGEVGGADMCKFCTMSAPAVSLRPLWPTIYGQTRCYKYMYMYV